ncbi:microsomal signal peptidase 25 kDa subunit-domain-containing protein [Lasiosphaeria miniovina]|uniref:Signal peptidase complex subunit 2 n=1 Tax=Lasiosphaeria miniovina TaxID=1954250 RepID=A0AA40DJG0_9PEZI|nr:microsomal signal peptidase 25 kDa subunit-domain-containing protein [Lasiosphaeria miniovina]KAK0703611.1 microsomal signal peptidase 25 kDa subunit-domain-containing protein [Lasiosphaeria miniovina]
MAAAQEKITVYNVADLKNTSDDAIPNYLNSLKFTQSHRLTDVRLALGYSAFAVAAACFLWDYKLGFESTKWATAAAVIVYMVLNGALTFWLLAVEKGTVYVGRAPTGETVRIATASERQAAKGQAPQYRVTAQVEGGAGVKGKAAVEKLVFTRSFAEWFDEAGNFVTPPFQSMLARAVPVVGKLDPKRVAAAPAEAEQKTLPATASQRKEAASSSSSYTPELLDALAKNLSGATPAEAASSSAEPGSTKKGGKRRKA